MQKQMFIRHNCFNLIKADQDCSVKMGISHATHPACINSVLYIWLNRSSDD